METEVRHLTRAQLARRLGVTVRTLELMEAKGEGPAVMRFGPRTVRYAEADVLAYEQACRQQPKKAEDEPCQ